MNDSYWKNYYAEKHASGPSRFALSCHFRNKSVIDIGCGEGQDMMHFIKSRNSVIGLDPNSPVAVLNMNIQEFVIHHRNLKFDIAYCRFLFHAIDESDRKEILLWIKNNCKYLYAEFRTDKGGVPDNSHDRSLINLKAFIGTLQQLGFDVLYAQEAKGLSPTESEDPVLARVIASI